MWRPILEKVVSYTEITTMLSLNDLIKVNDLLDMQMDLKHKAEGV